MSATTTQVRPRPAPPDDAAGTVPAVRVRDLRVAFGRGPARREVVHGVSLDLHRGRCLALVGESGSGKSVTARTLVGLTGPDATVRARALELHGRDLLGLREREWREVRGAQVGLVLQDALVSLDPLRPVGKEVGEVLRAHTDLDRAERQERVVDLLEQVGVPEAATRARQRPHELSGGLRQRALIATALAADPPLIVADEPTTALDVTVQAQVLDLLAGLKAAGRTLLVISHDLAVVARLADEVAVMRDGRVVEHGPTGRVLGDPQHPYTRALLDAVPVEHAKGTRLTGPRPDGRVLVPVVRDVSAAPVVAEVESVSRTFTGPAGEPRPAVRDVSFRLRAGETLGIVGESGSGKTTTARILLGLTEPTSGRVRVHDRSWTELDVAERRALRRRIQVVHQDPLSSFDPRYTVERILAEALEVAGVPRRERRARTLELLGLVGLGAEHLARRPLRLSGGQRQRVAIARALAPRPSVVVCDEPVSALDVSVQAQVLDLLADVQAETGVAYVFISHDLGVVHHVADRVLVMSDGAVVEEGDVRQVLTAPRHPYTRRLVAAVPRLAPAASPGAPDPTSEATR